jgi:hypothetical protein
MLEPAAHKASIIGIVASPIRCGVVTGDPRERMNARMAEQAHRISKPSS